MLARYNEQQAEPVFLMASSVRCFGYRGEIQQDETQPDPTFLNLFIG